MRVSVVSPNVSSNAMARTCPIAQTLAQDHDVEVLGFDGGDGPFGPYADAFDYKTVRPNRSPLGLYRRIVELSDSITGDVVYAFRPQVGSLGVALHHKRRYGTPIVLDVEDLVRYEEYPIYRQLYNAIVFSGSPTSGAYARLLERRLDEVDAVTVTSTALRERYGGTILPYGPDADDFDPEAVDAHPDLVADHGDAPLVVFVGTIRDHKGLDVLADAVGLVGGDLRLVIAGYDPEEQVPNLKCRSGGRVDFRGPIPHEAVPGYLAAADLVAVPQKATQYTRAQIPNKVFEAMAMGRPVVASQVSDLSDIIDGCGRIVEPGGSEALAGAIREILGDDDLAARLGRAARKRYLSQYGREALRERLDGILSEAARHAYDADER